VFVRGCCELGIEQWVTRWPLGRGAVEEPPLCGLSTTWLRLWYDTGWVSRANFKLFNLSLPKKWVQAFNLIKSAESSGIRYLLIFNQNRTTEVNQWFDFDWEGFIRFSLIRLYKMGVFDRPNSLYRRSVTEILLYFKINQLRSVGISSLKYLFFFLSVTTNLVWLFDDDSINEGFDRWLMCEFHFIR